jgi:pimeloyl-ACP methyl ester carboxylesterase
VHEHESLLARFDGKPPPAADWFRKALAVRPDRSTFDHDGAAIELLTWGERGKPGLLFLHGNGAHADWWSFIAPFFAEGHRCAAISWSGMGGSAWRPSYTIATFAGELIGAIDRAGLSDAGPPVAIGHSFGGAPLMHVAVHRPQAILGGILVDSFVPRPERRRPSWQVSGKPTPRYATMAEALARYRFAPSQESDHPAIVDHLARGSLRQVDQEWTWRFDPQLWATLDHDRADPLVDQTAVPIGIIYGEKSALVTREHVDQLADRLPRCAFIAALPEAHHHIMVDQPLALVAALRVGISALETRA